MALFAFCLLPLPTLLAQEASSGIDLRATVSAEALYSDDLTGGVRSVLYPVWKIGEHWNFSGAVQLISRPYFYEDLTTQGYGLKAQVLQAALGYSKVWKNASVVVRAGQMPSAFGAFLLRYDDADNPLIQMPMGYGYYYAPVTTSGLMGAQADATLGKWDARVQLVNSSPSNARSIFAKDQYGNWAGGVGYTIRQGLRVGLSSYRGPYLDRQEPFFRPGEAEPKDLPATAVGADAEWARGHWNLNGEWQHFDMTYHRASHVSRGSRVLRSEKSSSSAMVSGSANGIPSHERSLRRRDLRGGDRVPSERPAIDQNRLHRGTRKQVRARSTGSWASNL